MTVNAHLQLAAVLIQVRITEHVTLHDGQQLVQILLRSHTGNRGIQRVRVRVGVGEGVEGVELLRGREMDRRGEMTPIFQRRT